MPRIDTLGYAVAIAVCLAINAVGEWVGMPGYPQVALMVASVFTIRYLKGD